MSNKGQTGADSIVLVEDGGVISERKEVCDIFNNFFADIVSAPVGNYVPVSQSHPSLVTIRDMVSSIPSADLESPESGTDQFTFSHVDYDTVYKLINNLGLRKATGVDGISSKILRLAGPVIAWPIACLINRSIDTCAFPRDLKFAQIRPVHKKNESSDKSNYRPVSILPVVSKLFERVFCTQLDMFLCKFYNPSLSAFRRGLGCQSVLLRFVEDCRMAVDERQFAIALLTDLSKAFDCLPHDLMLAKLQAYGLSAEALNLISSYLSDRKQAVVFGSTSGGVRSAHRGVPQGSIFGPLLFNIFLNDIFKSVKFCTLLNYADDNTLFYSHADPEMLRTRMEQDADSLVGWFANNGMTVNPEKFQALPIGRRTSDLDLSIRVGGVSVTCESEIKLLGVEFDHVLSFTPHIAGLCRRASRQLNALKRIGGCLPVKAKLAIYHCFVMSNFNFCPLVWHFCGRVNNTKIERIQERALRFVYNDTISTYDDLLARSGLPSLHVRRMCSLVIETFKIVNGSGALYLRDFLEQRQSRYSFRYKNRLSLPRVRTTNYGLNSFRYMAPKIWNSLPDSVRGASDYPSFCSQVRAWMGGGRCLCNYCT